jgi:hypothetical protein
MGGQAWPDSVTYVAHSFVATAGEAETAYRGMSYVEQEQTEELVSPYVPRTLTL